MDYHAIAGRLRHVLPPLALACGILAAARIAEGFHSASSGHGDLRASLGSLAEGDTVARLVAPRLNLDFPVLEGIESATLAQGPGHVPGTPLPGEPRGTALIAIPHHATGSGAKDLQPGDRIEMRTPFGLRSYSVVERRILPPREIRARPASRPRVSLVMPFPADSLGPAPLRLAIVAEEI